MILVQIVWVASVVGWLYSMYQFLFIGRSEFWGHVCLSVCIMCMSSVLIAPDNWLSLVNFGFGIYFAFMWRKTWKA